ncbi:P-loop NTPase fold protein [Acinetobacter sp.]|uniref:KAP family P-loop NTPase fold protein n=1 Tax=Acinetobacter sp. TaxID=472 RepID=UPI0035B0E963
MSANNQLNWSRTDLDNIQQAWEGDLWDRKRLGIQLTNYVDRLQCGAVLALDARWGEGKTWFVRHWQKHLEDESHNVIYLDAFANDYLEDPFLVISSEIASKLDKTADKRLVHKFKKAAAVMQQGLLTLAPTLIASMISCALTSGIIPLIKIDSDSIKDKLDDVIDKVTENIGDKVTEAIQNKIDSYEEEKQSLFAFKNTLAQLAESLDKPLVFIIDELDRCRPDFAIRLIERIKHFFDIKNIVFVLVMDKTQFSKVVCHNYGYDAKIGEEYLDKFIDYSVELKTIEKNNSLLEKAVFEMLYKVGLVKDDVKTEVYYLILIFQQKEKLSTRSLKKIINTYSLLSIFNTERNILILLALLFKEKKNFISEMILLLKEYIFSNFPQMTETQHKYNVSKWDGGLFTDTQWMRIVWEREFGFEDQTFLKFLTDYMSLKESIQESDRHSESYYIQQLVDFLKGYSIDTVLSEKDFVEYWKGYITTGVCELN